MRIDTQSFKNSVTNRILAMKFAGEFILIYPLYTIMFGERGGVTAAGIGTILATGFVLTVLFEIPTGVIADKLPRKYIVLAGIFCKMLALLSWLIFPYFAGYLLGASLFALANALESGALQAYLYGSLGAADKKTFGKFWARVSAMVMLSYTTAYALATVIGVLYPLLIILSIAACLIAFFICLSLPIDRLVATDTAAKPKIVTNALAHIYQTKQLLQLLLGAIIIVALAEVIIEYSALYFKQVGVDTRYIPLLMALGNIIGAVLFWTLHAWEGFLNKQKIWLTVLVTLLFVATFRGGISLACAGLLILTRFLRVLQVQFESTVQHLSNDDARATISSIGSFAAKLVAASIVAIIGVFAVDNSIVKPLRIALLLGALLFIATHLAIRLTQKKHA